MPQLAGPAEFATRMQLVIWLKVSTVPHRSTHRPSFGGDDKMCQRMLTWQLALVKVRMRGRFASLAPSSFRPSDSAVLPITGSTAFWTSICQRESIATSALPAANCMCLKMPQTASGARKI